MDNATPTPSSEVVPGHAPARRRPVVRKPLSRPTILIRAVLVIMGFTALGFLLGEVSKNPPTEDSWYPKCFLKRSTGLECPGCGLTRMVYFFTIGDIPAAFSCNLIFAIASPYLILMFLRKTWFWIWGLQGRSLFPARASWFVFGAIIAFWIARNIPVSPFTMLRPPVIESPKVETDR